MLFSIQKYFLVSKTTVSKALVIQFHKFQYFLHNSVMSFFYDVSFSLTMWNCYLFWAKQCEIIDIC